MNTTLDGHPAPVLQVTRSEIFEDEPISEKLLREHRIPRVSFNVDLAHPIDPERIFQRVQVQFLELGFETERVFTESALTGHSLAHIRVSSVNRRTREIRSEKLVVVLVEGSFVSVTIFP
jgi:hypothetical protein